MKKGVWYISVPFRESPYPNSFLHFYKHFMSKKQVIDYKFGNLNY